MRTFDKAYNYSEPALREKPLIDVEPISRRIKIYALPSPSTIESSIKYLKDLGRTKNCDKLLFYLTEDEIKLLDPFECEREGFIGGFFRGKDAHIYSIFLNPDRKKTVAPKEEERVMELVESDNKQTGSNLPDGYVMRQATETDAPRMARLYDTVFKSYPTPINDPDFIINLMNNNVFFTVVKKDLEIVSACSADLLPAFNAAEMTDCATLPEHRGRRILTHQFSHLMQVMKKKGVQTLFSYSRALSEGMNLINARHGFIYGGRLKQQSNIAGKMESMNVWYKNFFSEDYKSIDNGK